MHLVRAIKCDYCQSLFWRTRREMSAGGFFTTIHSITEVAAARAYLSRLELEIEKVEPVLVAYHVNMYCV